MEARPIYDLLGHKGSVTAVQFSPKGDFIASGESDNMVFVWKTNFDITDKELGIVAPSIKKQSNGRPNVNTEAPTKSNSVLKEQSEVQNKGGTRSLNGNKENYSTNERISSSKVTIIFLQYITTSRLPLTRGK